MAPDPQRTQEQSIKARKHQLFDADEPIGAESTGPRRSFEECLRTTPADPLSTPIKALLWTVGTIVILLLVFALVTAGPRKPKPKKTSGFVPSSTAPVASTAFRPSKNEPNPTADDRSPPSPEKTNPTPA